MIWILIVGYAAIVFGGLALMRRSGAVTKRRFVALFAVPGFALFVVVRSVHAGNGVAGFLNAAALGLLVILPIVVVMLLRMEDE